MGISRFCSTVMERKGAGSESCARYRGACRRWAASLRDVGILEGDRAAVAEQRARDAVDQVVLPEPFGPIRREPLARVEMQVDGVERDEAAEALGEGLHGPRGGAQPRLVALARRLGPGRRCRCGATMTKITSSTPTISTFAAGGDGDRDDLLDRAEQDGADHRAEPGRVPPIIGMAIALTAIPRMNADERVDVGHEERIGHAGHAHQRAHDRGRDRASGAASARPCTRPRPRRRGSRRGPRPIRESWTM